MLSGLSHALAWLLAALFAAVGATMFVAPTWASANFAWNVSPMVAMTIGGWCLGNAWAAFIVARRWHLALVASGLVYLALFGLFEAGVLFAFFARLKLGSWLAWLYVALLAVNVIAAIVWLVDYLRSRPPVPRGASGRLELLLGVLFVLFVGFLGLYGLLAPEGSRGLSGGIFPEILSPFTLRAFGAFYLSIALAPIVLLFGGDFRMTLSHMLLSWGLIFFITIAAFVFIDSFDFAARPGQLLYFGAYAAVAVVTLAYMIRNGTGAREKA